MTFRERVDLWWVYVYAIWKNINFLKNVSNFYYKYMKSYSLFNIYVQQNIVIRIAEDKFIRKAKKNF